MLRGRSGVSHTHSLSLCRVYSGGGGVVPRRQGAWLRGRGTRNRNKNKERKKDRRKETGQACASKREPWVSHKALRQLRRRGRMYRFAVRCTHGRLASIISASSISSVPERREPLPLLPNPAAWGTNEWCPGFSSAIQKMPPPLPGVFCLLPVPLCWIVYRYVRTSCPQSYPSLVCLGGPCARALEVRVVAVASPLEKTKIRKRGRSAVVDLGLHGRGSGRGRDVSKCNCNCNCNYILNLPTWKPGLVQLLLHYSICRRLLSESPGQSMYLSQLPLILALQPYNWLLIGHAPLLSSLKTDDRTISPSRDENFHLALVPQTPAAPRSPPNAPRVPGRRS
ncbi:uncharacterized protein LY79DRAFT_367191 [Colletotrichum navitas]|uniref:Uncharacterized protein n=1 Tax=Colletotrichum navitas TaxID=681940 RepID=A0AAD8PQM4_9PEZI|nr:uncharacterized protein LY79DRAFT_367191 [Colletotrichum navitas]KAK1574471.1 hypothetical protein LY79DRAFT_367191 [Colletotrichum navitas]